MGKAFRAPAGTTMSPLSHLGNSRLAPPAHKSGRTSQNVPPLINVPTSVHLAPGQSGDGDTASRDAAPMAWMGGRFFSRRADLGLLQWFLSSAYLRSQLIFLGTPLTVTQGSYRPSGGSSLSQPLIGDSLKKASHPWLAHGDLGWLLLQIPVFSREVNQGRLLVEGGTLLGLEDRRLPSDP